MTYTFKLARRLAASRRSGIGLKFGMLPALLLLAACGGDATAPESFIAPQGDWISPRAVLTSVSINPSSVTVETNQLIRFLADGRNSRGDSVSAPIVWSASGGTILSDGRFSAATTGTFTVTARGLMPRGGGDADRVDTSVVTVVPRQPLLGSIEITPTTVTLDPTVRQAFLVTGRLKDGRPVPIGVSWRATGGSIDAGGNYVAGDSAGTFLVIATHGHDFLSDTAVVTIAAPPAPPEPAPVLAQVTLAPSSATLAPGAKRQFTPYGRTTAGDSVGVEVVFAASGGTVTEGGLYTAGSIAGNYSIIATAGTVADTAAITVTRPLGSGPASGIPLGPFGLWNSVTTVAWVGSPFSMSQNYTAPSEMIARIGAARAMNQKLLLAMTGGAHSNYLTNGAFDRAKWTARLNEFATPEIIAAVSAGVADGTIIGNSIMDEPEYRDWGGVVTKTLLDQMAGQVKAIFPGLPVGVNHGPDGYYLWRPTERYRVVDYVMNQYSWWVTQGDVIAWRDKVLAQARLDGITPGFSLNVIDGGVQDKDATWDCIGTGGRGLRAPNCRMTGQEIIDWGTPLGVSGCAMLMWKFDAAYMTRPGILRGLEELRDRLAARPARSCSRA